MLHETTINKMHDMRLGAMATSFREQIETPAFSDLSFEDRVGLIVDSEWSRRKNNNLLRLIKKATLRYPGACIEDIEYQPDRQLDKHLLVRLSTCNYIQEQHNIICLGASGAGKTYIACALGIAACRNFYSTKYIRLPDLLTELAISRTEGTFKKLMNSYQKVKLLILDEWLLVPLSMNETRDLMEIIERRHEYNSTVFISQFAPAGWHEKLAETTIADAILDRIVHNSHTVMIHGNDSMRKKKGINRE